MRDRVNHYPAELSGGEQQRVALARALAPHPAILVADEPTGNLDEATGREIIELLFAGHEKRGTTLVLVTHDTALAQRCDRVVRLRSGRIETPERSHERAITAQHARLTWRFALREMRGGLRGFAVFIACIALGVAAIAGVGSFARSLGDGLAREGRVILGGDVSFSLMPREASAAERTFLDDNGRVSVAATMRAMARAADGQTALVEIKAVDAAYPLFGSVALEPAGDLADALAERDGAFGAAVDPALLARLNLERGARITVGAATIELRAIAQERARQARRRHRLRPAPADQRGGAARDRPGAARQPGALALPAAPARAPTPTTAPRMRSSRPPRRSCPTPAGRCARAPTPRPRSGATSSASRSTSRWSA